MASIIPLSVAQRRLDAGSAVQYPDGSPVGGAVQQLGDEWQAIAERYEQRKAQQQAFDAEIAARRLNGELAKAEADAVTRAPADGAGLHDAMYGQVDPRDGRVVQTGQFDTLFDNFLKQAPADLRPGLIGRKEALRAAGSLRMAQQQLKRRDDYEWNEWGQVENAYTSSIAQSDPKDTANYEAIRQSGLDLIAKIGSPLARQVAETAWKSNAAKALVQAMIAQDPKRAAEMLGAAQVHAASGQFATAESAAGNAGAVAQDAIATSGATAARSALSAANASLKPASTDSETAVPLDAITYLKPGDIAALKAQANNATASQMIGANARVMLAEQNAPAVIAATGRYLEEEPAAQDFVRVYGAEEGSKRFDQFRITTGVAKAYSDMRAAPNQAIRAELRDAEPAPDGSPEERERYEVKAGAAQLIMAARDADPVAYVSQLFPDKAPDWSKVSTPQDFQAAVAWAGAAQQQLGFNKVLAVPQVLSESLGARYVDESVPLQQRIIDLSEIFKAVRDPEARFALAGQVFQFALARLSQNAADDPKITRAELEARGKALQADLIEMARHPARVRFDAGSWWQKPFAALNDSVRLVANGATFDQADKFAAGMNWLFSDKSYDELLAAEQAETEDAEDRAGSAGIAAKLLGAFATGHGFQSAGLTFAGKLGAEAIGLPGLLARSAGMAADGAVFGGVDAALNGRDIVREMGAGALFGVGGNALAEGLGAIGGRIAARLAKSADEIPSERADGYRGVDNLPESGSGASKGPTGQFYSVIFETRLDPTLYPNVSRPRHFQAANQALLVLMESEPDFAKILQEAGINLQRTKRGLVPRSAPRGYTWHHAEEPGVMQLVPRWQHDQGSIFQKTLHPNRRGGFSLWGK